MRLNAVRYTRFRKMNMVYVHLYMDMSSKFNYSQATIHRTTGGRYRIRDQRVQIVLFRKEK